MSEKTAGTAKKRGCAPLGCLIIIIAVGASLVYFIVKPALAKRGITVETVKEQFTHTSDKVRDNIAITKDKLNDAKAQADKLHEQTTDKLHDLKQSTAEKLPTAPIRLYEE